MVGPAYEALRFASVRSRGTRISPCRQRIRPALRAVRTHFVATCWLGGWVSGTVRSPRSLEALPMILSILEHTPIWVWVLFCTLIALGIAHTRTREVSSASPTLRPIGIIY